MFKLSRQAALLSAAFFLSACSDIPRFGGSIAAVTEWSEQRGFQRQFLITPSFELLVLARLAQTPGNAPLVIYIEGDGPAWPSPYHPPDDPTPIRPIALALAAEDSSAHVIYLGRPCQYLTEQQRVDCPQHWWTSKRFSPEVLDAFQAALDEIKVQTGHQQLRLVGYSGGGVIAALLADRRQDITHLTTLAAPLSLADWSTLHQVSPLPHALDPGALKHPSRVPAVHYVGGNDDIVPESLVRAYTARRGGELRKIEGANHDCCWLSVWKKRSMEAR